MTGAGLRIAFAGTPELAAVVLQRLLAARTHQVGIVFTQPDRPAGRGRKLTPSAVKRMALDHGLALEQPATAAAMDPDGRLRELDVLLVVAYGLLLPVSILERPRSGAINVHLSLLPRWRGAAPIQRAIQAGDPVTGVTIMQMDAGLDTGPILLQSPCPITPRDTAATLHDRLAALGADCALRALDGLAAGGLHAVPQDDTLATRAPRITRHEACIDWREPAAQIARNVRAFNPWPVCHTRFGDAELRILEAEPIDGNVGATIPGTICNVTPAGIDVTTGAGVLRITRLQLPGRRAGTARDFSNARHDWLHPGVTAAGP